MCTSLTYQSGNRHHFLARTMDFGFELNGLPIFIPRQYEWNATSNTTRKTRFGFIGTGRNLDGYLLADGVNEQGLAVAELYFLDEAKYNESREGKLNISPHGFIMWLLGEISSVEELKKRIFEINIINEENSLLSLVLPLHYIVTDKTGMTVVVETNTGEIELKENPVGVMTNSPELEWHLKNLNNYLSMRPTNFKGKKIGAYSIKPFGQGSGTFGMPGGLTSPERFVRTGYYRQFTQAGKTTDEAVSAIFHILNSVTIPKGVNIKNDGSIDYTQYRSILDVDELTYYFNPYTTEQVYSVKLDDALLSSEKPIEFTVDTEFTSVQLN